MNVGLIEVETLWSMDDVVECNAVLDALEEAETKMRTRKDGVGSSR